MTQNLDFLYAAVHTFPPGLQRHRIMALSDASDGNSAREEAWEQLFSLTGSDAGVILGPEPVRNAV